MTEKEIVQALRCCAKGLGHDDACENCKVGELQDRREYIEFAAANAIERLTAENAALREKVPQWISVEDRLPAELLLVNVVWVNRAPEPYYEKIKDVPFSGTACFYRDRWYWDSPVVLDLLAEYGEDASDLVDDAVEITHWMPLPEALKFADILRGAPEAPEEGDKHE